MNGSKHYIEAERLLSDASFVDRHGHPVSRQGNLLQPGEHAALIARAQIHATLALAAATALPTVAHFAGDNTEVTAWGKAIGAMDDGARPVFGEAATGAEIKAVF